MTRDTMVSRGRTAACRVGTAAGPFRLRRSWPVSGCGVASGKMRQYGRRFLLPLLQDHSARLATCGFRAPLWLVPRRAPRLATMAPFAGKCWLLLVRYARCVISTGTNTALPGSDRLGVYNRVHNGGVSGRLSRYSVRLLRSHEVSRACSASMIPLHRRWPNGFS